MTHAGASVRVTPIVRTVTLIFVLVPPLVLAFVMWQAWGGWFNMTDLVLLLSMYLLTGMGITIGYHRLLAHKSFEASPVIAWTFGILGSMAAQGPAIWWVSTHRRHHQHSDEHNDPHSPHAGREKGVVGWMRGAAHAHAGWLLTRSHDTDPERYCPDLEANRRTRIISRLFPLWVLLGFLIPAVIGGLVAQSWWGFLSGFLWGGVVRMCVVHHITWSVNSVCHLWGSRTFKSGDESRNNIAMGVLAFGEGWHNNHHAFPTSARHGLRWWQFDSSWIVIRTLSLFGLVRKIRVPSPDRMAAKRAA